MFVTFEVSKFDKSKYSNSKQDWNISDISMTLFVLNLLIPFISFILLHPINIPLMLVTFIVSKFDKSKYSNDEQPQNNSLIFTISLTFNLLIPIISFKLWHPLNILDIFITFKVSKFIIFNEIKFVQFSKKPSKVVISLLKIILNLYIPSSLN